MSAVLDDLPALSSDVTELPGLGDAHLARPHLLRSLIRRPVAVISLAFLAVVVVAIAVAPQLAPYRPGEQHLSDALAGPGHKYLLGTDLLGRDVLSRLMYGGRTSLMGTIEALGVFVVLGVPLGIVTGYLGGWIDRIAMRVTDLVLSIPAIILILVVLAVFPGNQHAAMLTLGVIAAPGMIRVVRAATLSIREDFYISAAQVSGVSPLRIMGTHVARRVVGPVLVQATLFAGFALIFEASLGFLGLSSSPATPSWGGMVAEASTVLGRDAWLLVPSGSTIALVVVALGLVGDTIGDISTDVTRDSTHRSRTRRRRAVAPSVEGPAKAAPSSALLHVVDLSVSFGSRDELTVVDRVSFEVYASETLGLVGESGCGKSITALALLGLLPAGAHVTSGSVVFDGIDLVAGGRSAYNRVRGSGLAFISQDPLSSLDPTHTVGSHLAEVVRLHERGDRAQVRARVRELLEHVNLPDPDRVARAYPHELSGGMAQRVAIAIALAGRPRLLIADEPTTALDVIVQAEILALLRRLRAETGMAILLITHDWGVVADICTRAAVMYAGEVVEQAPIEPLFAAPRHPYSAALQAANPSAAPIDGLLPELPGRMPSPGLWPSGCRFATRCEFATAACRNQGRIPLVPVEPDHLSRCIHLDALVAGASR